MHHPIGWGSLAVSLLWNCLGTNYHSSLGDSSCWQTCFQPWRWLHRCSAWECSCLRVTRRCYSSSGCCGRSCLDDGCRRHVCCCCSLCVVSMQLNCMDFGNIPCRCGWINHRAHGRAWTPCCALGDSSWSHALGNSSCSCTLGDSSCSLGDSSCNHAYHCACHSKVPHLRGSLGGSSSCCFVAWCGAFWACVCWQSDVACTCSALVACDTLPVLLPLVLSCAESDYI